MPRTARIDYPDALHHVTTRGNQGAPIFVDRTDRERLLVIMRDAFVRHEVRALAYCQMTNHYHVLLHTQHANLAAVMQQVNGGYTHAFNRRHARRGHLFQGRFASVHVDRDAWLLSACRYVDLNPVRARMLWNPAAWPWSSYRTNVGLVEAPDWLDRTTLHASFLGRAVDSAADIRAAGRRYAEWVKDGRDERLWEVGLREGQFLGDEAFVRRIKGLR